MLKPLNIASSEMRSRAGPLPKEMPPSLEILILGDPLSDGNNFSGGIPTEWGSLTKLKKLKMAMCGLDGTLESDPFNKASFEMRSRAQGCCLSRSSA